MFHVMVQEGITFLVVAEEVGSSWEGGGVTRVTVPGLWSRRASRGVLEMVAVTVVEVGSYCAIPSSHAARPGWPRLTPSPCCQSFGRRIPFGFLEDIRQRFMAAYSGSCKAAVAYEYNTEFSRVLAERLRFFATDPAADTISRVQGELLEVRAHRGATAGGGDWCPTRHCVQAAPPFSLSCAASACCPSPTAFPLVTSYLLGPT